MMVPVFSTFKSFLMSSKEKAVDGGCTQVAILYKKRYGGDFYQQSHRCSNGVHARNGAGTIILMGM